MLIQKERKITKEQYDRAKTQNAGHLLSADEKEVFSASELYGYGVYSTFVYQLDGEYYVSYCIGDSCD